MQSQGEHCFADLTDTSELGVTAQKKLKINQSAIATFARGAAAQGTTKLPKQHQSVRGAFVVGSVNLQSPVFARGAAAQEERWLILPLHAVPQRKVGKMQMFHESVRATFAAGPLNGSMSGAVGQLGLFLSFRYFFSSCCWYRHRNKHSAGLICGMSFRRVAPCPSEVSS